MPKSRDSESSKGATPSPSYIATVLFLIYKYENKVPRKANEYNSVSLKIKGYNNFYIVLYY